VHDTGPGIKEKDRNRIFQPFFSRKVDGRGLGLFLSKDILQSRGHQLYLVPPGEEPRPINGACFCIELKEAFKEIL
jgi:signal transduction histidine kinase